MSTFEQCSAFMKPQETTPTHARFGNRYLEDSVLRKQSRGGSDFLSLGLELRVNTDARKSDSARLETAGFTISDFRLESVPTLTKNRIYSSGAIATCQPMRSSSTGGKPD